MLLSYAKLKVINLWHCHISSMRLDKMVFFLTDVNFNAILQSFMPTHAWSARLYEFMFLASSTISLIRDHHLQCLNAEMSGPHEDRSNLGRLNTRQFNLFHAFTAGKSLISTRHQARAPARFPVKRCVIGRDKWRQERLFHQFPSKLDQLISKRSTLLSFILNCTLPSCV